MRTLIEAFGSFRAGNHLALLKLPSLIKEQYGSSESPLEFGGDELTDLLVFSLLKMGVGTEDFLDFLAFKELFESKLPQGERLGVISYYYASIWQAFYAVWALRSSSDVDLGELLALSLESPYRDIEPALSRIKTDIEAAISAFQENLDEDSLFSVSPAQFFLHYKVESQWQQMLLLKKIERVLTQYLGILDEDQEETESKSNAVRELLRMIELKKVESLQTVFCSTELKEFSEKLDVVKASLTTDEQRSLFSEFNAHTFVNLLAKNSAQAQAHNKLVLSFLGDTQKVKKEQAPSSQKAAATSAQAVSPSF